MKHRQLLFLAETSYHPSWRMEPVSPSQKKNVQEKNLPGMECWQKTRKGPNIQAIDMVATCKLLKRNWVQPYRSSRALLPPLNLGKPFRVPIARYYVLGTVKYQTNHGSKIVPEISA